jgi:hypothetical protein
MMGFGAFWAIGGAVTLSNSGKRADTRRSAAHRRKAACRQSSFMAQGGAMACR